MVVTCLKNLKAHWPQDRCHDHCSWPVSVSTLICAAGPPEFAWLLVCAWFAVPYARQQERIGSVSLPWLH